MKTDPGIRPRESYGTLALVLLHIFPHAEGVDGFDVGIALDIAEAMFLCSWGS